MHSLFGNKCAQHLLDSGTSPTNDESNLKAFEMEYKIVDVFTVAMRFLFIFSVSIVRAQVPDREAANR